MSLAILAKLINLGRDSESAVSGMPPEVNSPEEALLAIKTELKYGRWAYSRMRELEQRFGVEPAELPK